MCPVGSVGQRCHSMRAALPCPRWHWEETGQHWAQGLAETHGRTAHWAGGRAQRYVEHWAGGRAQRYVGRAVLGAGTRLWEKTNMLQTEKHLKTIPNGETVYLRKLRAAIAENFCTSQQGQALQAIEDYKDDAEKHEAKLIEVLLSQKTEKY